MVLPTTLIQSTKPLIGICTLDSGERSVTWPLLRVTSSHHPMQLGLLIQGKKDEQHVIMETQRALLSADLDFNFTFCNLLNTEQRWRVRYSQVPFHFPALLNSSLGYALKNRERQACWKYIANISATKCWNSVQMLSVAISVSVPILLLPGFCPLTLPLMTVMHNSHPQPFCPKLEIMPKESCLRISWIRDKIVALPWRHGFKKMDLEVYEVTYKWKWAI